MDLKKIIDALRGILESESDQNWIIDDEVWLDGDWKLIQSAFHECEADLLATDVRTHAEDPGWRHWASLNSPPGGEPLACRVAALLPLMRISRVAAKAILNGIEEGWAGHPEALIPTLVKGAGLRIEDIGGSGSHTPHERIGNWYDRRTWHWRGPVAYVQGKLHYPVPRQKRALERGKNRNCGSEVLDRELKLLYVSPVGDGARELLPDVLAPFLGAGADCWLLQYDMADLSVPESVRVIRDKGFKFPLALRHLHPDAVAAYDYIFFWDDDLGVGEFDPLRFAKIMMMNRLEIAQPAIQSPHRLSYAITKYRPSPVPSHHSYGINVHPIVGRLTNFVEIMAPVFTREAWRSFYSYLDPNNHSGWGYDYIPLGRKGIVDALPVVHTRAVQSNNETSKAELRRFLDSQGLICHAAVDQGWLFEPSIR